MSLALIQESAKEVRRLAIAGSPLAVGDFRLKKLIAPLEQAGAKVPVFAQVARSISDLVNGKEADSAAHLLGLSTLLNAILYTQGQSGAEAEFAELEMFSAKSPTTQTPARVLKPIIEALTSTGSGRFEIVKSAVERGAFNDLRLIEPTIRALNDNYPELADLVAEKILPAYGSAIVPLLKKHLVLKGKKSDARRLRILHELDPAGTIELCKTALEDGSPDVKAAAIVCLGRHEDCLPLVLEQTNSKNKSLRAAALEALAAHDRPDITTLFTELIKGKALDILARPLRAIRNQLVLKSLLDEGQRVFDLLLKGDSEQNPRYFEILNCLEQRKDAASEAFLLTCFNQCEKLARLKAPKNLPIAGADLMDRLASLLCYIGTPQALEAVLAKRDVLPLTAFPQVARCALRSWTADKVYQEFAPLLEQKKGAGKDKGDEIQRVIVASRWDDDSRFQVMDDEPDSVESQDLKKVEWDPRWLEAAIKGDRQTIVCCLAKPGHKGALTYLVRLLESKKVDQSGLVVQALARSQYPKVTDLFLDLVARKTKKASYLDYEGMLLFESARRLPAADLPKLEAFVPKLDEKFTDLYLEAIAPLRPTSQTD